MSFIQPPPSLEGLFNDSGLGAKFLKFGQMPELQELILRSNDEYYYWTDVQYRVPQGLDVTALEVWAYIKLGRQVHSRHSPVKDKNNQYFSYWISDGLHRDISEVDKLSGGPLMSDHPFSLPAKERYIIHSLMDEAIASSQLEGASTEYRVAKEMLRSGRSPKNKSETMIVNNWKAMQYIRQNIKTEFTLERLCELQTILTQDTLEDPHDSGHLRTTDDIEVRYKGEIVHIPPPAVTLQERVGRLLEFVNKDSQDGWIHPVIKGAMIHFWLAYDHPFNDGNGRTARALMYWYLLSRNYELFQYLSISKHFLRAPGQYEKAYLQTEHDENDLNYFLVYNLSSVRAALNELREYLQLKQQEMSHANQLLHKFRGLNLRQKNLIYHSIQHPNTIYSIESHKNSHGIAYDTARKDLMLLATKGFLKKQREGKKLFIFFPTEKAMEILKK